MLRDFKRRLLASLPPIMFLGITFYFGWNAVHGARGLEAQTVERAELVKAQGDLAALDLQRANWETRIAAFGGPTIAPEMLDEQARRILNLAAPTDIVVELPSAK